MFELFNREKEIVMISYFIPVCQRGFFFRRVDKGPNKAKLMFPGGMINDYGIESLYDFAEKVKEDIGDFSTDTKALTLINTTKQGDERREFVSDYWMIDLMGNNISNGRYVWISASDFKESCEPQEFVLDHYDTAQCCVSEIV